jgi:hypothetical protein
VQGGEDCECLPKENMVNEGIVRWALETMKERQAPESETIQASVSVKDKVSIGRIPGVGSHDVDARDDAALINEPEQLSCESYTDPDELERPGLSLDLVIEGAHARLQEGEDIESLIHPAGETLKLLKGVSGAGVSEVTNGGDEFGKFVSVDRDGHVVGIDIETNDGKGRAKELLALFMWDAELVP